MNDIEKKVRRAAYMREYHRRKKGLALDAALQAGRPANVPEILWAKVDIHGEDDCWPWKGFKNEQGYGRTWINGKGYYAHRVIFDLANPGAISLTAPKVGSKEGSFLRHRCDNPICCNPKHLIPGTHTDNMQDKVARGRSPDFSGDKGPRCKLTMEQAAQARALRGAGQSVRELAGMFGISLPSMKTLLAGKSYRV